MSPRLAVEGLHRGLLSSYILVSEIQGTWIGNLRADVLRGTVGLRMMRYAALSFESNTLTDDRRIDVVKAIGTKNALGTWGATSGSSNRPGIVVRRRDF